MRRTGNMGRVGGALVAVLVLQGCYTYVRVEPQGVSQGTVVRARMSTLGSFDLREITVHNIRGVDGELVRADPDSVVLSALWLDAETGRGYAGDGWTVEIPAAVVERFEARRFSRWRTAALAVAGVAASWVGFDSLRGLDGSRTKGGGGGQKS